jgi:FtsH-binding integral membrane protein
MSRTYFYTILGLISTVVLASMLPNRLYQQNDRQFIVATLVTCALVLVALILFLEAI